MATIGIKIANGEFYAILEEASNVKKRLILTTVHDGQKSVQIDLYKSEARRMADAAYIGSLVVENIKPQLKGEPSMELIVSSNPDGEINADVSDMDAPGSVGSNHLSVSLKTVEDSAQELDIPDFELDTTEPPPTGLYDRAKKTVEKEKEYKVPWLIIVIVLAILLILGGLIWFFLIRPGKGLAFKLPAIITERFVKPAPASEPPALVQQTPVQPSQPAQPPTQPPAQPRQQVPVIQAPAQAARPGEPQKRVRPPAPVSFYAVPQTIPREGAPYKLRWGDTLWDISEAFYRNPWLYPRIARFNDIKNPDYIIAGTTILIPPRN